eukprot:CAMPEP_0175992262 /NCGR_PEP_ID=MMETSP0108-20121206/53306_1 /TAXON_ID=195067 ORGANISM="Goniomonas pacifica, Strain CCMP1869" /NCGR_SAMPLE_ID=MMETSP0108 /ASSEMBLY_ACC=CAM_ASM_000204 /LENGTH=63 /DNA_ID=CAMNT_0017323909 /DNA_START=121 /DNA_END=309 /DNA_ORIENTATION=-
MTVIGTKVDDFYNVATAVTTVAEAIADCDDKRKGLSGCDVGLTSVRLDLQLAVCEGDASREDV